MNTKLTLNLDKDVIEQAKTYAKDHKVSLSQLIENYLDSLTKRSDKKSKISPLVESLTGVIPNGNHEDRKDYQEYLSKKYS
jgi:ribosome recycling factor